MIRRCQMLIAGLVVAVSACAVPHRLPSGVSAAAGTAVVSPPLQFTDVPVPSGFTLVEEESFQFEHEVMRVGLLRYSGRLATDRVAAFYQEQMPQFGWGFINEVAHDRYILSFEKPFSTCTVTIENTPVNTQVSVAIAPYSQGSAKEKLLDKN